MAQDNGPAPKIVKKFEDGSWVKSDGSKGGGTIKFKSLAVRKRGSWDFDTYRQQKIRQAIYKAYKVQPWETK